MRRAPPRQGAARPGDRAPDVRSASSSESLACRQASPWDRGISLGWSGPARSRYPGCSMDAGQVRRWIAGSEAAAEVAARRFGAGAPDPRWPIRRTLSMIDAAHHGLGRAALHAPFGRPREPSACAPCGRGSPAGVCGPGERGAAAEFRGCASGGGCGDARLDHAIGAPPAVIIGRGVAVMSPRTALPATRRMSTPPSRLRASRSSGAPRSVPSGTPTTREESSPC